MGQDWGEPEALREGFAYLDHSGFRSTSRLPLFAARNWSPAMERRVLGRFRRGECNLEEAAVPRWYWRKLSPSLRSLFSALSLGLPQQRALPPISGLVDAAGMPRWRVINRFDRYILHSRPTVVGDEMVYFGDDTLFLMQSARESLDDLPGKLRILDLCCGGGGVGLGLQPFAGELEGVDINPAALALARLAAAAQGLSHYSYQQGDATRTMGGRYDLVVGNPPTLPTDLAGGETLYATGSSGAFLELLAKIVSCLKPRGRALLTVFSTAEGKGERATDSLRGSLRPILGRGRAYRFVVRRHFPLSGGRWLRHVALEILPERAAHAEEFLDLASSGIQLPWLSWRRGSR